MKNRFMKMCSILLVVVLIFNMLPHRALADMLSGEEPSLTPGSNAAGGLQDVSKNITEDALTQETDITEAEVVGEVIEKRTEFSKEFRLSNGLHMAAVYDSPVHYKDNGQWKEIDNTLNAKADGTVTNTAGVWNISFPQKLSAGKYVNVSKDGYTLRFGMGGVLSDSSTAVMRAGSTFSVQQAQVSAAQVQLLDAENKLIEAKHPETVATKLNARLQYSNVYSNTNVVYDLQSNKLKESVVINRYDSSLRGYRYTLDVGKLVPELQEDNSVLFYDENRKNVIMIMPAPFMVDADKVYNYDVKVILQGFGSSYTLQYILPQQWLAAEERAWPVVLDPVVTPATNASNIQDVTVAQNATVSHTSESLQCGYNSTWGKHRFLIKFNELPRVTSSDVIVGAEVGLYMLGGSSDSHPVEVHKVNSVWQASSLTWSSAPGIQETSEDFVIASQTGMYYWDVTNIVRDWYNGPNTGMLFKITTAAENAQAAWTKQFCASDYSVDSTMIPSLTVYFRNGNGQEGYWGYTSSSAGRAGTGFVNNFTGNLTWVREDMGFGGNRMPVSISHIYNLNDAVSPADSNNANDTNGNAFGLGVGWRTNFNQRIFFWQVETEYIGWEDGDGTDHYFRYDSGTGKYKDEDGLDLIFSTDGGGSEPYYITDKQGNRSYFDAYGRLTKQINNQATQSCIEIVYDGLSYRIATITDGAGRVYSFSYTNNLLNNITYLDSLDEPLQTVSFAYEGGKLTQITDADNRSCRYTYTSAGVLTTAQDIDDYTLTYSYNSPTQSYQPYRVLQVTESDYSEMEQREAYGGAKTFDYDYNQTKITDHNGNVQVIQFNNYGDVTAVYDDDGRGQFSRYSTDTDPNGTPHQLKSASDLQNTVVNLLKNSNFRRYDIEGIWSAGTNVLTLEVSYLEGYRSSSSLEVEAALGNSSVTGPTYPVNKGETITFSAYIKSDNALVQLAISEVSTNGTANCIKSDEYDYADNIDYDPEDNWRRIEVSYTNNTAAQKNICPQIIAVHSGYFYVDCVQLEYAVSASRYNWIDNGDFRLPNVISSSGYSTYWSSSGARAESVDTGAPQLDENVWEFSGLYNGKYRSHQEVFIAGDMYDTFVLAGWGKGNATPSTVFTDSEYQPSSDRFFGIKARFNYTDGTHSEEMGIAFNSGVDAWQYGAAQITAEKAYESITVYLAYEHGANTVYFDGIQLYYGFTGTTYTYDQNNNPKTVTDPIGNTTTYTYDQQTNDLICEIGPDGTKTEYWYDNYHNLVRKKVSLPAGEGEFEPDTEYSYTYDEYGNQLSVVFSSCPPEDSTEERKWTSETYTYSSDGNRLLRTTDTLGNVTEYDYDPETGLLMWVMDPEGNYTEYSYNNMFQLKRTGVDMGTDGTASVGYSYDGNDLASISTATTQYNIEYCELFGLRQRIHIDESSIVFYYYTDDENHYLSGIDFCNGSEVYYTYDEKGRRIKEEFSEGDTVDSVYNSNGNLSQVKDSQSGITTNYYYDDNGRNARYTEKAQGYDHEVAYSYNGMGDISAVIEKIGTDKFAGSYDYDELNRVERYSYADIDDYTINVDVEYVYDRLGRVTTKYTKNNGTTVLTESYTYVQPTGGAGKTSSQIATYTTTAVNGYSVTYSYTYDDNGNILSISDGSYITSYAYDNLNQLVRENNEAGGYTYVWDYDKSGNILSRTKYNYTTGTLGAAITAADYCYGDSYWGDLMTSYDGMYVEYEGTGNLIFYGNDFYSWEHGHELVAITSDIEETEWNFSYNADGMRIQRSGDGKTYKYVYNGGQLSKMTVGGNTLHFSYDADGTPLTVIYNGTTYYYATNLQGDVVAILNSAGTAVVRYTYDSWGNILTTTGSMSSTLGFQNPLRYRGYVYDEETGLYYLQSRYYNPEWGRFISADSYISTGQGIVGHNMFAYCGNNPVCRIDITGTLWKELIRGILHAGNDIAIAFGLDTAAIGAYFLQMNKGEDGAYHAEVNCWQRGAGYNNLYDSVFGLGTSMMSAKFPFSYNGSGYTIWAWKGDYLNLGAGAELGIYRGSSGHRTVDTSLAMWMGMIVKYNGNSIVRYFPDEDQWWITGFNPDYLKVDAKDLRATIGVGFNVPGMYWAFKNQWGGDSRWVFYDLLNLAIFQF